MNAILANVLFNLVIWLHITWGLKIWYCLDCPYLSPHISWPAWSTPSPSSLVNTITFWSEHMFFMVRSTSIYFLAPFVSGSPYRWNKVHSRCKTFSKIRNTVPHKSSTSQYNFANQSVCQETLPLDENKTQIESPLNLWQLPAHWIQI